MDVIISIGISALALILAVVRLQSFRFLRPFMVFFALGAGQIHLALVALGVFLVSDLNLRGDGPRRDRVFIMVCMVFLAIVLATMLSDAGWRVLSELLQLAVYVGMFFLLRAAVYQPGQMDRLMAASAAGAVATALLGLLLAAAGMTEAPAIFLARGANEASTFLVIMGVVPSVFLFIQTRKPKYLVFIGILFLAQIEATSRINILLSISSICVMLFFLWRSLWWRLGLVAAAASGLVVNFALLEDVWERNRNYSYEERFALYEGGIALWEQRPWFGWGWGSSSEIVPRILLTDQGFPHFHSTYIQFLVELGVLGIFLTALWFIGSLKMIHRGFARQLPVECKAYLVAVHAALIGSGFTEAMLFGADRAVQVAFVYAVSLYISDLRPMSVAASDQEQAY